MPKEIEFITLDCRNCGKHWEYDWQARQSSIEAIAGPSITDTEKKRALFDTHCDNCGSDDLKMGKEMRQTE